MTYRALLVGNSIFEADAGLNPLNAPTKDVARLHGALVDAETGLFEEDHLRLVTERKRDEILDEIDDFFASGERDDLMLFYYSGHGVLDEGNQLYLCGRDTRSDRLPRTGIRDSEINNFIQAAASRRTILILDCCHSGTFKGGSIGHQLGGPGRYLIASTRGAALANDSQSPTGTSVFTERLVEGLLGGATDSNQDGLIDLREIYEYIKRRLTTENSKQIPYSRFDGDGDISLARTRPLPAIAIATDPGRNSDARAPSFGLSENVITLRDVDPQERLLPEIIEIVRFTDSNMDIVVEVLDPWLTAVVHGDRLTVTLTPHEGNNRGKVMVRDRITGSVQTLRVEAFVRQRPGNAKSLASSPAADRVTPEPRAGPTQPNPATPRHPPERAARPSVTHQQSPPAPTHHTARPVQGHPAPQIPPRQHAAWSAPTVAPPTSVRAAVTGRPKMRRRRIMITIAACIASAAVVTAVAIIASHSHGSPPAAGSTDDTKQSGSTTLATTAGPSTPGSTSPLSIGSYQLADSAQPLTGPTSAGYPSFGSRLPKGTVVKVICAVYGGQADGAHNNPIWYYTNKGWINDHFVATNVYPNPAAGSCTGSVVSPGLVPGTRPTAKYGPFAVVGGKDLVPTRVSKQPGDTTTPPIGSIRADTFVTITCSREVPGSPQSAYPGGTSSDYWDEIQSGGWIPEANLVTGWSQDNSRPSCPGDAATSPQITSS